MAPTTLSVFAPPATWQDTADRTCIGLHVRVDGDVHSSAWKPSPEELEILNAGGSVVLSVLGGQPPVSLMVKAG